MRQRGRIEDPRCLMLSFFDKKLCVLVKHGGEWLQNLQLISGARPGHVLFKGAVSGYTIRNSYPERGRDTLFSRGGEWLHNS